MQDNFPRKYGNRGNLYFRGNRGKYRNPVWRKILGPVKNEIWLSVESGVLYIYYYINRGSILTILSIYIYYI